MQSDESARCVLCVCVCDGCRWPQTHAIVTSIECIRVAFIHVNRLPFRWWPLICSGVQFWFVQNEFGCNVGQSKRAHISSIPWGIRIGTRVELTFWCEVKESFVLFYFLFFKSIASLWEMNELSGRTTLRYCSFKSSSSRTESSFHFVRMSWWMNIRNSLYDDMTYKLVRMRRKDETKMWLFILFPFRGVNHLFTVWNVYREIATNIIRVSSIYLERTNS